MLFVIHYTNHITSINGLVVEHIVAIDVIRFRLPADACSKSAKRHRQTRQRESERGEHVLLVAGARTTQTGPSELDGCCSSGLAILCPIIHSCQVRLSLSIYICLSLSLVLSHMLTHNGPAKLSDLYCAVGLAVLL